MLGGQAIAAGVSTMDDLSALESGLYLELINKELAKLLQISDLIVSQNLIRVKVLSSLASKFVVRLVSQLVLNN